MKRRTLLQIIAAFLTSFLVVFRGWLPKRSQLGKVSKHAAWFPVPRQPLSLNYQLDGSQAEGVEVMRLKNSPTPKCPFGEASCVQEARTISRKMIFPATPGSFNIADDEAYLAAVGSLPEEVSMADLADLEELTEIEISGLVDPHHLNSDDKQQLIFLFEDAERACS